MHIQEAIYYLPINYRDMLTHIESNSIVSVSAFFDLGFFFRSIFACGLLT